MDDLTERKLQSAYGLIKAGKRAQAREILVLLARANPNLTDCWFLLGHAVSDPQEKVRCFQQVLRLDPGNQQAQKQLAKLLAQKSVSPFLGAKAVVTSRSVDQKKQPSALFWGIATLVVLIICLSGFGLFWSFNQSLFTKPALTVPGNTASLILPAVTLAASTPTLGSSQTPKPTSRPTFTLAPTQTARPSVTIIPTLTLTFTKTPSRTPGPKPKALSGCAVPNGVGMLTAPFKIENVGKESSTVNLKGQSKNSNYSISCQLIIKQGKPVFLTLMLGDYEYSVVRGATIRSGSFFINQDYKATMRIFEDKIQIGQFQ